jgi:SAM-dependent methyltransferase
MKILDLGSGLDTEKDKKEGVITLDVEKAVNPDVVWDLNKTPLPFKNNEFDEARAYNILEHLDNEHYENLIEEIHRILKPKGIVKIIVPYFSSSKAFETTGRNGHCSYFAYNSFWRYEPDDWAHYTKRVSFKIKKLKFRGMLSPILNLNKYIAMFYQMYFCWIFPQKELYIELEAIK